MKYIAKQGFKRLYKGTDGSLKEFPAVYPGGTVITSGPVQMLEFNTPQGKQTYDLLLVGEGNYVMYKYFQEVKPKVKIINADGQKTNQTMAKTIEQKRGAILALRLKELNDYLVSGSTSNFGQWLKGKGISEKTFLKDLPKEFQVPDVFKQHVSDEDEKDELEEYTEDMNILYHEQYLEYEDKLMTEMEASGENLMEGVVHGSDTLSYYASGKRKKIRADKKAARKKKKEEVKAAKAVKKAKKKQIKEDVKSGKISKKEGRKQKKAARKELQEKVGSGARRAISKFNKLNPGMVGIRVPFLSLMAINAAGMASAFKHMANDGGKHWKKFVKKWEVMGGDETTLKNTIANGAKKKPFPRFKKRKKNADGSEEEMDENNPKNAGKAAAGAAAALIGLAGVLATNPPTAPAAAYVGAAGGVLGVASPILISFGKSKGEDTSGIQPLPLTGDVDAATREGLAMVDEEEKLIEEQKAEDAAEGGIMAKIVDYKYYILGGIALAAVAGFLMSGSKKSE